MEEPDYDSWINDYVDDYEEPSAEEYDEAALEEMMGEAAATTTTTTTTNTVIATTPGPASIVPTQPFPQDQQQTVTALLSPNHPNPVTPTVAVENEQHDVSSSVNDYLSRQNDDSLLYNFERFNRNKKWRRSPLSPNSKNSKTLKAKTWKNNDDRIALRNFLFQNLTRKHAPEAQLLELLQSRGAPIPTMKMTKNKGVYSMPKEGEATLPMTLADGTRVYVRMRSCGERKDAIDGESSSSLSSSSSSSLFSSSTPVGRSALGVSMRELKRRADAIRRKQGRQRSSNESRRIVDDGQLWVDKHAPSSFPHLLSDERTNREVLRALRAWDPYVFGRDPPSRPAAYSYHAEDKGEGQPNATETTTQQHDQRPEEASRVILLSGPPGVGKTTLAHILARHAGYRPLEVNGSDERSAAVLTDRVRRAMESNTIQMNPNDGKGKPNCLILDEIDGADAKGAIQSLVEIIRAELPPKGAKQKNPYLRRPIIFICNHKYAPALRPLLPYAKHFNVNPPSPTRLVARLKAVLSKEKLSMMAGGSLLHQLVVSTGGDIRSCLYTLQFAAAQASDSHEFAQALASSLGGTGLKDDRSDISTTITAVFRKFKTNRLAGIGDDRAGVARVFNAVEGFGDNPGTINSLFMNLLRVSYIDPTFDRCSAAHDWLSGADLFCSHKLGLGNEADQYTMQRLHTPSVAAAIHLLCRVELKPDLSFSTREIMDAHYQREANVGLVHKFSEGLPPKAKSAKCQDLLSTEFIPMILWILSAGTGNSSLSRAASSIDVLTKLEKLSVEEHVAILRSLGLTYVADQDPLAPRSKEAYMDGGSKKMRLEPPIDRLVHFQQLNMPNGLHRHEIPSAMKELLAQEVRLEGFRQKHWNATSESPKALSKMEMGSKNEKVPKPTTVTTSPITPRKLEALALAVSAPKRLKTSHSPSAAANFLGIGAKKAREAKSARKAAAVGLGRSKKKKMTHTGSGMLLSKAVRLKYVKGFTQAVRTPCRLRDLE